MKILAVASKETKEIMKPSLRKTAVDERGVAHVIAIVLVAVILVAGGYALYKIHASKTAKTSTPSTTTSAAADSSCVATYHDATLCHFASNSTSLAKLSYKGTITENQGGSTSTIVLENDGKGNTTLSGTSNGTTFNSVELSGATYLESNGTWIKYPSGSSTATATPNPTSSMNIGVGSAGITYKKIGTAACGKLTCYEYQVIDASAPSTTQYAWFDNSSYLLREWKYTDASGNTTDMTLTYEPITITAPSPVESLPSSSTP